MLPFSLRCFDSKHRTVRYRYSANNAVCLISLTEVYSESGQGAVEAGTARGNKYKKILSLKTVHTLAFFILVYVGTEVRKQLIP